MNVSTTYVLVSTVPH